MATKTYNPFGKLKSSVPNRQEGDGHEIKVEVREDEEQSAKLQEILDLLIAAGYFKARIKGLSSFDKVVGGMTWCIESCNVDVDVDLLFQENSTIGQKIALTEKIVGVLPKLQCPHQIQPHQIQGLDFIHIFPVIQWLVKRSIEHRSNTTNFLYSYALNQFEKEFHEKQEPSEKELKLIKNIKVVEEIYKPHRAFRRKHVLPIKDLNSKVQLTLLEYGYKTVSKHSSAEESSGESYLDQQLEEQLMNNLVVTVEETFDFDNLTQEDQEKLLNHYENLNKELKISGFKSVENQQHEDLKDRTKVIANKLKKLEGQNLTLENKIEAMNSALEQIRQQQMEADTAFKELNKDDISTEKVNNVQDLVIQSENLKKQEIEFRDKCKKELQQLRNSIEKAKERKSQSSEEIIRNIEQQLHEQNEKLKVLRLKVAKKSRVISVLQRRIDDVPCRAELAQYQRRFIELYNQISAKHKETKQYYSLYNTLEDTRLYMEKELSLLNSVSDNYPQAMASKEGKEEFLQQFIHILEGVGQSKIKLEKRLSQEKKKRDELSQNLHSLIELNRKYVGAIKQLKLECQKNEALQMKININ